MRRLGSAALAAAGILLVSCGTAPGECTASSAGFGSAPAVKLTLLTTVAAVPAENPCRARFEVLRTQAELASAYTELGLGAAPTVDFVAEVVIVRAGTDPAGVQWSVLDKGGIVVGLRGCQVPADGCAAAFYSAPAPVTSIDSRTCDAVACGFSGGAGGGG